MDPTSLRASQTHPRTSLHPGVSQAHPQAQHSILIPQIPMAAPPGSSSSSLLHTLTFMFPFVSPLSVQANSPVSTSPLPALFSTFHQPNIDMKQAGVLGITSKESLAYIIKSLQVQYSRETFLSTHWSALEIQVREIKGQTPTESCCSRGTGMVTLLPPPKITSLGHPWPFPWGQPHARLTQGSTASPHKSHMASSFSRGSTAPPSTSAITCQGGTALAWAKGHPQPGRLRQGVQLV